MKNKKAKYLTNKNIAKDITDEN